MNRQRPVTMIDELPEVDEMEAQEQHQRFPQEERQTGLAPEKYAKYIRTNREMYKGSGMERYEPPQEQYDPQGQGQQEVQQNIQYIDPPSKYAHIPHNCLDIASHVQDCPICSKFYNTDKTIYIIIIIILSLICLLLVKKLLNL